MGVDRRGQSQPEAGRVNPGPPLTSRPLAPFHPVRAPENHAQHRKVLHRAGATRVGEKSMRKSLNQGCTVSVTGLEANSLLCKRDLHFPGLPVACLRAWRATTPVGPAWPAGRHHHPPPACR